MSALHVKPDGVWRVEGMEECGRGERGGVVRGSWGDDGDVSTVYHFEYKTVRCGQRTLERADLQMYSGFEA